MARVLVLPATGTVTNSNVQEDVMPTASCRNEQVLTGVHHTAGHTSATDLLIHERCLTETGRLVIAVVLVVEQARLLIRKIDDYR